MTQRQIELIQNTWDYVTTNIAEAGDIFYGRLFEKNPEIRSMFTGDIKQQSRKLVAIITFAVKKLDSLGDVIADVQALGKRHDKYGVNPSHYPVVADSLLWTLEKGLGERWNDEVKEAWVTLYTTLSGIMIGASKHNRKSEPVL